jgi:hypothetical protein
MNGNEDKTSSEPASKMRLQDNESTILFIVLIIFDLSIVAYLIIRYTIMDGDCDQFNLHGCSLIDNVRTLSDRCNGPCRFNDNSLMIFSFIINMCFSWVGLIVIYNSEKINELVIKEEMLMTIVYMTLAVRLFSFFSYLPIKSEDVSVEDPVSFNDFNVKHIDGEGLNLGTFQLTSVEVVNSDKILMVILSIVITFFVLWMLTSSTDLIFMSLLRWTMCCLTKKQRIRKFLVSSTILLVCFCIVTSLVFYITLINHHPSDLGTFDFIQPRGRRLLLLTYFNYYFALSSFMEYYLITYHNVGVILIKKIIVSSDIKISDKSKVVMNNLSDVL